MASLKDHTDEHWFLNHLRGHGVAVQLVNVHHLLFGRTLIRQKLHRREVTEWEDHNFFLLVLAQWHILRAQVKNKRRTSRFIHL